MKNRVKILVILAFIVFCINTNNVKAIQINVKNKVSLNETITVVVDFGTYVAAYDKFELRYNDRVLKYNSTYALIEELWWDTTKESKGINKKTYSFTAIGNGTNTFELKIEGLVSANEKMENLGDFNISKRITIGSGAKLGDVNGDGLINADDAALVLDMYKYGKSSYDDKLVADINKDGSIDADDAALILDIYKYGN